MLTEVPKVGTRVVYLSQRAITQAWNGQAGKVISGLYACIVEFDNIIQGGRIWQCPLDELFLESSDTRDRINREQHAMKFL